MRRAQRDIKCENLGDSFAFSPISVTISVTNTAKSPKFSPNFVSFYSTEFPPEFSPNLVTYSSPKFSPFSSIHHNLCQNRRKFGRKFNRNQFRLYPQKILPSKVCELFRILKRLVPLSGYL